MKITPCCKTKNWHTVNTPHFETDTIRCEICGKVWNKEQLEIIYKGFNPTSFFCDKCHSSLEEFNNEKICGGCGKQYINGKHSCWLEKCFHKETEVWDMDEGEICKKCKKILKYGTNK